MSGRAPTYTLRPCDVATVADLCARFHGYQSAGDVAVYAFAVYEDGRPVAGWLWQPPPPGSAASVCPEMPAGVLALSRMVAVPKCERRLPHVSRPLRRQMAHMLDRGRWPVLVTYSDIGQGHNGFVYQCSGWTPDGDPDERDFYLDTEGRRVSPYANGAMRSGDLVYGGKTAIQRWRHDACPRGEAARWMAAHGWERVAIPGKTWRSGNQAYRYEKRSMLLFPDGV